MPAASVFLLGSAPIGSAPTRRAARPAGKQSRHLRSISSRRASAPPCSPVARLRLLLIFTPTNRRSLYGPPQSVRPRLVPLGRLIFSLKVAAPKRNRVRPSILARLSVGQSACQSCAPLPASQPASQPKLALSGEVGDQIKLN